MCLRISSAPLGGVIALAACSSALEALPGEAVECARGAEAAWTAACTIEHEADGSRFVVHHRGGRFRRLLIDPATRAVAAADGADKVAAQMVDQDYLTFTIGDDRYRVPLALLANQP
jgi:hypothetical protein